MNLQIVVNTEKNLYLKQAPPRKYLPNFLTQENLESKMVFQALVYI